jgi:uncharacterized membrane protein
VLIPAVRTTTELTSSWAQAISKAFGFGDSNKFVEVAIRALFFALNLIFNGVMWGLFTRALTLATSTVRVSVINTSSNFMITAVLGAMIFKEALPGVWWLGASMLVAGSVIIGRREEDKKVGNAGTAGAEPLAAQAAQGEQENRFKDEPDEEEEDERIELETVEEADDPVK